MTPVFLFFCLHAFMFVIGEGKHSTVLAEQECFKYRVIWHDCRAGVQEASLSSFIERVNDVQMFIVEAQTISAAG